ncbi:NADH dehydrogenase [Paracoccus alcaliphilus]|uniref:NADH dehydrogenase n=1 Tax=Paracoccus alcaliphilus TaxID=34002 RepID=A0A1H8HR56_9RHOB|nr:complex I NDUFA9 subunit family protein [Paracoccus alcaliphilus]WCR19055.1 complex I NDUFA9 subunit family protein [Paracoccus alcaliphilus]SEN58563.1 NADH dehydrogenase [Paracoccus alcaliphilus]
MSKLVTIYGGSGFVGRQVARRLAARGWRVRIAVRRPDEALFTRTYGAVGQVVPVLCNIRDADSVRAAMAGADAVVNCVNLLGREGKSNFDNVLVGGAGNIARIAAETGVGQVVHLSGIGVDAGSPSRYVAAKAKGEAAVLQHFPAAVVLRPSVIFGNEDYFYNRFASLTRLGPLMPVPGLSTRIQPVHVDDVAEVAAMAVEGRVDSGIYELGGPNVLTVREIVQQVLTTVNRRRLVLSMPLWIARIGAGALGLAETLTGGLFRNRLLTRDQIVLLSQDNIVSPDAKGFADLGIQPTAPAAIIDTYLWRFRASGQYEVMREPAQPLNGE